MLVPFAGVVAAVVGVVVLRERSADLAEAGFPGVSLPAHAREPRTRKAYAFALSNPDVLDYAPCYRGCWKSAHHSNRECFVKSESDGGDVEFDHH